MCPYLCYSGDTPQGLLGDAGIQELWANDGGQVRVFFFSHLLPITSATLTTFYFIPVWARGSLLHPILILCDIYQFLLLGQKHTIGTEGTRILRIPGPKEILENSEVNRIARMTMMV